MATQGQINKGMKNLLMMATELLEHANKENKNFIFAQNLVRQAFFKYLDLADCPFRETCRDAVIEENEREAPYNVRDGLD